MRTYGGKFFRNALDAKMSLRTETQDAILWDINTAQNYCRVKIQGSDTLIYAYYPLNFEVNPSWLKVGNAVKIMHTGGSRGRIELVGNGGLIPTAIPGGTGSPPSQILSDTMLSGLLLTASNPASMTINYSAGTYRISGTAYSVTAGTKTLDAASSSYFRYDKLVIGADGTVDIVKGSNFSTGGTIPTTPTSHLELGYVLVIPNATAITDNDIYRLWDAVRPASMTMSISDESLTQTPIAETTSNITLTLKDQYGRTYDEVDGDVTATFVGGGGTLSNGGTSSNSTITITTYLGGTIITFTKTAWPDSTSAIISFTCTLGTITFQQAAYIEVLDLSGNPIPP